MKTLYLSDLDGTLLNASAELSPFTAQALSALASRGVLISAATARTGATAVKILEGTGLTLPVILMNGVCVLDLNTLKYIRVCRISPAALGALIDTVHEFSLAGFLYGISDNTLFTCYENLNSPGAVSFVETRRRKYGKRFTKVEDFTELADSGIVYYSISDKEERLAPAAERLRGVDGLRVEYYRDIYEKDCFFLEVCSAEASKFTAVNFIREYIGADRVVGFGDNFNDLPLLEACDEFYAVENAVDDLKKRASGVIGANTDDGVAHWLLENAVSEEETL